MKEALHKYPFFTFLLPVFFVLHGFASYFHYLDFISILPLLGLYLLATVIVFLLMKPLVKQPLKAGLLTFSLFAFFFFFGSIVDFLKTYSPTGFLKKFSVINGIFLLCFVLFLLWLRKTRRILGRPAFFLNTLLLIYLAFDIAGIVYKSVSPSNRRSANLSLSGLKPLPESTLKPDIYLLLFDEYAGNISLNKWLNFDNSDIHYFLLNKKFRVIKSPKSNYDATPLSMASLLEMDYINWYKPDGIFSKEDWIRSATVVKNNKVCSFLEENGYEILNHSIFDLVNHPAPIAQRFLAVNTRLITEETLISRFLNDFSWLAIKIPLISKILPVNSREDHAKNLQRSVSLTLEQASKKNNKPRFIYMHLLAPHLPAYFDRNGNKIADPDFAEKADPRDDFGNYLENVQFVNLQIKNLVNNIQHYNPDAVIMIMSDHGFRWTKDAEEQPLVFNNQNAIYLPSQQYDGWTDSVTNVNQFRILFNSLFSQQLPILKDSFITTPR